MSTQTKFFAVLLGVLTVFSASAKAETFIAYLTPAQEAPPSGTNASGYARVLVNEAAGTLSFVVVFRNLSSFQTASHIHAPAPIGVNAAVIINFGAVGGISGTISGSNVPITPTQLAQIRQHLGYVNVHSQNFPGGEIRGQLGPKRPIDFDGDGRTDLSVVRWTSNNPPTGPMQWYTQASTDGFEGLGEFGDASVDYPAPGDYDGDGKDDICVFRRPPTVGTDTYFYLIRSSDGTFQAVHWGVVGPLVNGSRSDLPVSRDYDGDGTTDMAVFRPGTAAGQQAFWYYRSSLNGFNQVTVAWGTTGNGTTLDVPAPADYDGDGKVDVAVFRNGIFPNNNYIIRRSSDGTTQYQQWGDFQTDYIVPSDYDGDGKADFASARVGALANDPMVWIILKSADLGQIIRVWGLSSDAPVQGDYDGDARTDIAVYRRGATTNAQSYFHVINSLGSVQSSIAWGRGSAASGTPPFPNYFTDFPLADYDVR